MPSLVCKQNNTYFRVKHWFLAYENGQTKNKARFAASLSPTFQKTKRLDFKAWFGPKPRRSLLPFLRSFLRFPNRLSIKWIWMSSSRGRINTWPLCLKHKREKKQRNESYSASMFAQRRVLAVRNDNNTLDVISTHYTHVHRVHGTCG